MEATLSACVFLAILTIASGAPFKMDNILDLSYAFVNKTMPYFPGNLVYSIKPIVKGRVMTVGNNKQYAATNQFETAEHGGTHYDAPSHFCNKPSCWFPEDIPVSRFFGEACVVNITENASKTPNYGLSVADLMKHERMYGMIPDDSYVIMYSGWGKYFTNKTAYMGHETNQTQMAWPSFSPVAMKWLLDNRSIKGIGVDSLSLDVANVKFKMTHYLALGRNKVGFENLANVEKLPARGATIFGFPMNLKKGTGGPARVVAMWNNGSAKTTSINMISVILFAAFSSIFMLL